MTLKFRDIPRQEEYDWCGKKPPRYVHVVPEATWRKIVKVLKAADKEAIPPFEVYSAVKNLRKHLEKQAQRARGGDVSHDSNCRCEDCDDDEDVQQAVADPRRLLADDRQ